MKHWLLSLILKFGLALSVLSLFLPVASGIPPKEDSARVVRVLDGDTLKVNYKGKEESVRLIGVDAPESRVNEKAKMDAQRSRQDLKAIIAMGKEATKYVKTLVKAGGTVKIEFDVEKRIKTAGF